MTQMWPGDELTADSGKTYRLERMVAYQGKDDCTDLRCTRSGPVGCIGYHCPACDEPCSMMGHDCPKLKGAVTP